MSKPTKSLSKAFEGQNPSDIHAKLRFTNSGDVERVLNFYRGNRHQHVHIRDEALLEQLVTNGDFLILEDKKTGDILASSGAYPYRVAGDKNQASYAEIGSTRFSDELAGFGLYPLFIASQVIHGTLTNSPKSMYIANVYDDSPVGRELLTKKVGWNVIQAGQDILDVFYSTKDKNAKGNENPMTWYGSPPQCLPHQASIVMEFIQNKQTIAHKRHNGVLHLDFSEFELYNKYFVQLAAIEHKLPQAIEDYNRTASEPLTLDRCAPLINMLCGLRTKKKKKTFTPK